MKTFKSKPQSYFITILTFFLVINLLILLTTGSLYYTSAKHIINKAFSEKNLTTITQVDQMFNVLHSQMIPGLKEASYNNHDFSRLMYADDLTNRELLDGIESLDNLLLSYPLINSLYIYNGQMEFFLTTSKGLEKAEDFFDKEVLNLVRNVDNNLINRYWPRTTERQLSYNESEEGPVLTLLIGTTKADQAPLKGAFISNIDVVELQKILDTKYNTNNDEIFIINDRGEWVCQSLDDSFVDIDPIYKKVSSMKSDAGTFTTMDNQLVSYKYNHRLGWYFIGVMSLDKTDSEMFSISRTVMGIMIILLFLSILLSYIASRHVYRPIDSLMKIFKKDGQNDQPEIMIGNSREFSFIADRYTHMLNEKTSLEDSLDEEIFRSLITGQEYHSWEEELNVADVEMLSKPLSLVLIQIDQYFKIIEDMKPLDFRLLRASIIETINKYLGSSNPIVVDMDARNIVCLIPRESSEFSDNIEQIQTEITRSNLCSVTISWVERENSEEITLNKMYLQVLSAVGGKFSLGLNRIIPYDNQDQSTIIFSRELADKLQQYLCLGNLPGALQKLEELKLILKDGTYQDFIQNVRIFSYRLMHFIKDRDQPEIQKVLQNIRTFPEHLETLDNFAVLFKSIIESIEKGIDSSGSKGREYYPQIDQLVRSQYKDANCCVQSIASDLGLSPNYIRQIYKNSTDHSLSDDLVLFRVEEACRLLNETNDPVKELYQLAGFTNYNSFFTSFKRIKGITPAAFRRNRVNM